VIRSPSPPDTQRNPVEPWALVEKGLPGERAANSETVFSLGNGRIGIRGSFEQGTGNHTPGTLINGFHETWPIVYPEVAYGYATTGQTIVWVPDATGLAVTIDGAPLDLAEATEVERRLDFRTGVLSTTARFDDCAVGWRRLVSRERPGLVAFEVTVTVDRKATVGFVSGLRNRQDLDHLGLTADGVDPRRAPKFHGRVFKAEGFDAEGGRIVARYRTVSSGMGLSVGLDHRVNPPATLSSGGDADDATVVTAQEVMAGGRVTVSKLVLYGGDPENVTDFPSVAFDDLVAEQTAALDLFWDEADIEIVGDDYSQQALRWVLFQLGQASTHLRRLSIPAKALTGQAYEGHYFWDTDMFVLPFLAYTNPEAAADIVRFRASILPIARQRAGVLSQKGALFPWRTINGEEASAYYEAGTAQYHIDAAVAYGVLTYVRATGDESLMWECGAEILVETARLWADLGFYREGEFHIHGVTGPDEYSALVDDNAYTNLMAKMNLLAAVEVLDRMQEAVPAGYAKLVEKVGLDPAEPETWRKAAAAMFVPYDPDLGITPQDNHFLHRQPWDWNTPEDRYPLLFHYHPLVIYRHKVLKQADTVLATYVIPDEFGPDLKKANFDYYDPITTGDSSLSCAIQSIVAAEIGRASAALEYFKKAAFLDLQDLAGNTADGLHMATAGGVWMAAVHGLGGFKHTEDGPAVDPRLPDEWQSLSYRITIAGVRHVVKVTHDGVTVEPPF
jgi:alpha,alpha-trehalose phosphorylase